MPRAHCKRTSFVNSWQNPFVEKNWNSGDWNLSDALTKKTRVAREGLIQFFNQNIWKLKFDPTFIQSEKEARQMGKAAVKQMQELQALLPVDHDPRKLNWRN